MSFLFKAKYPLCQESLSIEQKFMFKLSEIRHAQWNDTFRLYRPEPSGRAFGYCNYKQDTEEPIWGQQLWQMKRNISFRPTDRLKH